MWTFLKIIILTCSPLFKVDFYSLAIFTAGFLFNYPVFYDDQDCRFKYLVTNSINTLQYLGEIKVTRSHEVIGIILDSKCFQGCYVFIVKNQWDDGFGIVRCAEFYNVIPHWVQSVFNTRCGFNLKSRKFLSFCDKLCLFYVYIYWTVLPVFAVFKTTVIH